MWPCTPASGCEGGAWRLAVQHAGLGPQALGEAGGERGPAGDGAQEPQRAVSELARGLEGAGEGDQGLVVELTGEG